MSFVSDYQKTETEFRVALESMASRLSLLAKPIAAVMWLESRFNPAAVNPTSGATGLIQFMPGTAKQVGTTVQALKGMSRVQQLPFVERYFNGIRKKPRKDVPGDYYMAVFNPAHVGKAPDYILYTRGSPGYDQNRGLDSDNDGAIRVKDIWRSIDGLMSSDFPLVLDYEPIPGPDSSQLHSWLESLSSRVTRLEAAREKELNDLQSVFNERLERIDRLLDVLTEPSPKTERPSNEPSGPIAATVGSETPGKSNGD